MILTFVVVVGLSARTRGALPAFELSVLSFHSDLGYNIPSSINESRQVALTTFNPASYGSSSLRWDPDGSVHAMPPPALGGHLVMDDGRVVSDYNLPNGLIGLVIGNETSYQQLPLPAWGPVETSLVNVFRATSDASLMGCIDGSLVKWVGLDFTPVRLTDTTNVWGRTASKSGRYIAGVVGDITRGWQDNILRPFVYHDGVVTIINIPGFDYAEALGVNDDGTVIGAAFDWTPDFNDRDVERGFIWKDGVLTWLAPLTQRDFTLPCVINNDGLVIGWAQYEDHSFNDTALWYEGQRVSLNDLILPQSGNTQYLLTGGSLSMNEHGDIVGEGTPFVNGYAPTVLLTRVIPDPAATAPLLTAPTLLLTRRRNRR